jgi:hypothetical protein
MLGRRVGGKHHVNTLATNAHMDSAISHGKQKEQFGGTEPHVDNDTESIAAKQLHIGSS